MQQKYERMARRCALALALTIVALVVSASLPAGAQPPTTREIAAVSTDLLKVHATADSDGFRYSGSLVTGPSIGRIAMFANGRPVRFSGLPVAQGSDVLLVPLGPIADAIGASAQVGAGAKTVAVMRGEAYMTFDIVPNGPPRGPDDSSGWRSTMVPLRFITDALSGQIRFGAPVNNRDNLQVVYLDLPRWPPPAGSATPGFQRPAPRGAVSDAADEAVSSTQVPAGARDLSDYDSYNLEKLNSYRLRAGAPPLMLDDALSAFATNGSLELMNDHRPHQHFRSSDLFRRDFKGSAGENQGDPHGWPPVGVRTAIDQIMLAMYNEGPGGGHYENMMNPLFRRVGIGLVRDAGGRLYLTNDFSQ